MSHDSLAPDEWRLEDQPRGWVLRYRPPVTRVFWWLPSAYGRVPDFLASPKVAMACILVVCAAFVGARVLVTGWNASVQHGAFLALAALCLQLFCHYLCSDIELNAEQRVVAGDGRVNNGGGLFPEPCLQSLRVAPSKRRDSRRTLVFSGASVPEAVLVGEPGLSEDAAQQLLRAVLARVGQDCATVPQQNCEPTDAMDSRASSLERHGPATASH